MLQLRSARSSGTQPLPKSFVAMSTRMTVGAITHTALSSRKRRSTVSPPFPSENDLSKHISKVKISSIVPVPLPTYLTDLAHVVHPMHKTVPYHQQYRLFHILERLHKLLSLRAYSLHF